MSKLTDYKGDVMVAVRLRWEIGVKPNSLAGESSGKALHVKLARCTLSSDRVTSITISKRGYFSTTSASQIGTAQPLAGIAQENWPICDLDREVYMLGPINTMDLQALIDSAKVAVQMDFSYREIFDVILCEWQSAGTTTLANRNDDDALLTSFVEAKNITSKKHKLAPKYRELSKRIQVNATILDNMVEPELVSGPPVTTLEVLLELPDDYARVLCAVQWSSLSEHAARPPAKTSAYPKGLISGFLAIQRLLAGTVNLNRGRQILIGIVGSCAPITDAKQLMVAARSYIDEYIIAANHWGEARESFGSANSTERYQARMSDFLGTLYENRTLASPVNIIRGLFFGDDFGINLFPADEDVATLWLQLGVGHCGEHARVGFRVLRDIMSAEPGSPISDIIQSGNANIDHAFVLVNLAVDTVFRTRVVNKHNKHLPQGSILRVFDLEDALAAPGNGGGTGPRRIPPIPPIQRERRKATALTEEQERRACKYDIRAILRGTPSDTNRT